MFRGEYCTCLIPHRFSKPYLKCKPANFWSPACLLAITLPFHWYTFGIIIRISVSQNVMSFCFPQVTHCALLSYLFGNISILLWNHVTAWTAPFDFINHGCILNWLTAVIVTVVWKSFKIKSITLSYRHFPCRNLMTQGGLILGDVLTCCVYWLCWYNSRISHPGTAALTVLNYSLAFV